INMYIKPHYKDVFHANFLSKNKRDELKQRLEQSGFNHNDYQALLSIPKTQFWSDKFLSYNLWTTHFNATMISLAYQLPMANALLSRPSTSQNANGVQFLSHPLIVRESATFFPNKKDILLVLGKEHPPLSVGEQFLIDQSEMIYEDGTMIMYKMPLQIWFSNQYIQNALAAYNNITTLPPLFHESYDNIETNEYFYSKGAQQLQNGVHKVLDRTFENLMDTVFTFSAWTKIDSKKYWLGDWKVQSFDKDNALVEEIYINLRNSYDVQHQFVRGEADIKVKPYARIVVDFIANQPLIIDDLIIDYKGHNHIIDDPSNSYFLYNGYKILKKQ
ncbi:MAG TPA: hypothetical protein PKD85_17180, partial [Saprospiraceae bacterium]|nr:hypothetical protein [Saprospiraceae bacterium]